MQPRLDTTQCLEPSVFEDPFQGTSRGAAIRTAAGHNRKPQRGRVPGEVGIWVFIAGDLMIFSAIFLVFTSARMDEPTVFETGRETLHIGLGAINTLILLVGSLLVVRGIRAMRTESRRAPLMFMLCWLCGLHFVVIKLVEYSLILGDGHSLGDNLFYGYYFIFTGVHLLHLVLAMAGMAIMWRISRRPLYTSKDMSHVEVLGAYWHLVDLLWVILFPLIYLMRV